MIFIIILLSLIVVAAMVNAINTIINVVKNINAKSKCHLLMHGDLFKYVGKLNGANNSYTSCYDHDSNIMYFNQNFNTSNNGLRDILYSNIFNVDENYDSITYQVIYNINKNVFELLKHTDALNDFIKTQSIIKTTSVANIIYTYKEQIGY